MDAERIIESFNKLTTEQKWLVKKAIFGLSQPVESWTKLCEPMRAYAKRQKFTEEDILRVVMNDRYGKTKTAGGY